MQQLVSDALNEIWSTPDTSNQYILKPGRITPDGGVMLSYQVLWDKYTLPNNTSTFHLYQIGQIHPTLINLFAAPQGTWELLSDACNNIQMVADVYTALGLEIPRCRTWYMVTKKRNVLLAVEQNARLNYDFDADAIYLRTYRNAYFQRPEVNGTATLSVAGQIVTSNADIVAMNNAILALPSQTNVYCFVNGYKVGMISMATAVAGDVCEYVYDSSIYKVVDFQITSLHSFLSTKDSSYKYLLHYPTGWDGKIDFIDNIDMFMIDVTTQKGVYVHKNDKTMLSMVTFKDYSVVADYLRAYFPNFLDVNGNLTVANLSLRLHIRYDGNDQTPVEDANRLHYLLQLPDAEQVSAMVGLDATVPVWNAADLEQCAYTALMRADYDQVTLPMAEAAYGYSVANRKLALNTHKTFVDGGSTFANAPIAFQNGCTAYEYDSTGKLIGYYPVSPGVVSYPCVNAGASLVEFIAGSGGVLLDETYGEVTTTITPGNNYRWYMRQIVNNALQSAYTDVTGQGGYTVAAGAANWTTTGNRYRIVRSDKTFYANQVSLQPSDGVLQYTIQYNQGSGMVTMSVPLGELDLWLNGNALVPGIDYIVNFPTITIFSKAYLVNAGSGAQVLTLRMTGFCKSDLSSQKIEEIGFVWDGVLSVDQKYGVHYYKSNRIVVGGALVANEDAQYVEDISSGTLTNGLPYAVREMINPLNGFIDQDPYAYYAIDVATDVSVSNYLSLKLPQVTGPLNPIPDRYQLYSPFICKVIYALNGGNITSPLLSGQYPDSLVQTLVAPYLYLLKGDPITVNQQPDARYVVIEPHWLTTTITLSADNFRFLSSVVRIYGNGLVDLSALVGVA